MATLSVLERELYSQAEAARLLDVPQGTLHYWLEGKTVGHKTYRPVIRQEPRGRQALVTWAEFVEAGLLRQYRREHKIEMWELRTFIAAMRESFDVPYPLADRRPWFTGRALLYEVQQKAGLSPELQLVAVSGDQYLLLPASEAFVRKVEWDGDVAQAWCPKGTASAVRISPDQRFGRPSVRGISTEVLWEHDEAGESVAEIADAFDLTVKEVRAALAYENDRQAA